MAFSAGYRDRSAAVPIGIGVLGGADVPVAAETVFMVRAFPAPEVLFAVGALLAPGVRLSLEIYISIAHCMYKSVLVKERMAKGDGTGLYVESNGRVQEQTCVSLGTTRQSVVVSDTACLLCHVCRKMADVFRDVITHPAVFAWFVCRTC